MTKEEFNIGFKIFSRYLKDNGKYSFIVKFLFPYSRPTEKLLDTFNKYPSIHFSNIFNYELTLGPNYTALGNGSLSYWNDNFSHLHYDWSNFCRNHKESHILCEL